MCLKSKDIAGNSFKYLIKRVKHEHLNKIMNHTFTLMLSGLVVFFIFNLYFHRIKKFVSNLKRRRRVTCKECNLYLCNVMCEKCFNMVELCHVCYLNLQRKIEIGEIYLKDVKCCFCNRVLDYCQRLNYQN